MKAALSGKKPVAQRKRNEKKEEHATADDGVESLIPVSYSIGSVCFQSLCQSQETHTIVPEDQLKLSAKELEEEITRLILSLLLLTSLL
jgi:hypothetical protein